MGLEAEPTASQLMALMRGTGRGQPSSPAWDEGASPDKAGLVLQVLRQRKQARARCLPGPLGEGVGGKAGDEFGDDQTKEQGQRREGNAGKGWGLPARWAVSPPPPPTPTAADRCAPIWFVP